MGFVIIFALFVTSLVLQGSVLALVSPGGVHPDFLLIFVIALALLSDSRKGALLGLGAGLLQDILFASPLGFFATGKMLAGTLAGLLAHEIYRDFIPAPMLLVAGLTLFNETVTYLLMDIYFNINISLAHYLQQYSLPRAAMHLLLMALIYPHLYRCQQRQVFFTEPEG
jgi:rod shape-determining protein MreD